MFAPCPCIRISFFKKFRHYFNISLLIKSFFGALALSLFILFDFFNYHNPFIETLLALIGFYLLLTTKKGFWIGFFFGVFWFWWISLSFRYYDLSYLIPLIILFIGFGYGVIFEVGYLLASYFPYPAFFRALFLLLVSYIHPFGFNWFIPELALSYSFFRFDKLSFALFLFSLVAFIYLPRVYKLLAPLLLLFILSTQKEQLPPLAPLKIKLVTTHLPQDKKWDIAFQGEILHQNFTFIHHAIKEGFELVVLPESAFPLFLNEEEIVLKELLKLSRKIAIVTGALSFQDGKVFNSTFVFDKGKYIILNKVVLVPFGEANPLPKPLAKLINHIFFNDAQDYTHATTPQIYSIKDVNFTNAICYEATHPLLYKTSSSYLIAISNNAWFLPSYEPNLQNLLIRYYALLYNKRVYHATNMAQTKIIP